MDTTPGKDNEPFDPLAEGSLEEPDEGEDEGDEEQSTGLEDTDPSLQ